MEEMAFSITGCYDLKHFPHIKEYAPSLHSLVIILMMMDPVFEF
jgi:hypothetical protein